jgi:hypothetical protein
MQSRILSPFFASSKGEVVSYSLVIIEFFYLLPPISNGIRSSVKDDERIRARLELGLLHSGHQL